MTAQYPGPAGGGTPETAEGLPGRGPLAVPAPPPALTPGSFTVPCPVPTPTATCLACQGHGVIGLPNELRTLDRSRASVLAGIRQLAVEFGQVAPGAYLRPDGTVVYGVDTGRRLIDQPGYEPPRPRALRHLRVVR